MRRGVKDLGVPISHPEEPRFYCLVYTFFKPSPQDMFVDLREREEQREGGGKRQTSIGFLPCAP